MFRQLALVLLATSLSAPALAQNSSPVTPQAATPGGDVTRATLDNGLRVVIVRDPLAPVVTVEENYLVGANETPPGFPGMAHAQEHMAFRGCAGVTADQIAAIFAQLGGFDNADTQQTITQYFTTVPAADLEVALRVDAACMRDVLDSNAEWQQEKGRDRAGGGARSLGADLQVHHAAQPGHVRRHAVRARRARHPRVVREDDGRDAQDVLPPVVRAEQRHPRDRGRRRSRRNARDGQGRCTARSRAVRLADGQRLSCDP